MPTATNSDKIISVDPVTNCIQVHEEEYNQIVPNEQMHQMLTMFLDQYFGNDHTLCRLLKCVDQAYVVSLLGNLAETLYFCSTPMRFKDIQGTWTITIRKNESNYSFIHHRREQVLKQLNNVLLAETFQFNWELELISDSLDFNHIETMHVRLLDFDWSKCSEKIQWENEEAKQKHEADFRLLWGSSNELVVNDVHLQQKEKMSKDEMLEIRRQAIKDQETKLRSTQQQQQQNQQQEDESSESGFTCTLL
jgi:hypothetical protein